MKIDRSFCCTEVEVMIGDNWSKSEESSLAYYFPTSSMSDSWVGQQIIKDRIPSNENIGKSLKKLHGSFAGIIESGNEIVAFVDTVRSIPIFFSFLKGALLLSNSANKLYQKIQIPMGNRFALVEFIAGGYATGNDTIYNQLFQLQAGEIVRIDKSKKKAFMYRYFRYSPESEWRGDINFYQKELSENIDEIFCEISLKYRDRPIWIPLSGGLDSRLVLTKLKEHGCREISTFSYGNPGNFESKMAKFVAKKLDVPWIFVPPFNMGQDRHKYFVDMYSYWDYADGCSSIPAMDSYDAIVQLISSQLIPKEAVIINGQTGDFISGGHLPAILVQNELKASLLIDTIVGKHFSLWAVPPIPIDSRIIRERIASQLAISESTVLTKVQALALYERWEWEERQAKLVVNGQRLYEWASRDWLLPLWDFRLIKFWEKVPFELKLNQKLYKNYLNSYNYSDLFDDCLPEYRKWVVVERALGALGTMCSAFGQPTTGSRLNKLSGYWGKYAYQYSIYGFSYLWRHIDNITSPPHARGVMALGVAKWIERNGVDALEQKGASER